VHAGVYAVGHAPLTPHARYMAAVLAAGPPGVLSHRSAASLWGVQPHHGGPPHVASPVKRRPRAGIAVHWTRRLAPREVTTRRGIPVTALVRTLVDLADLASPAELEEAIRAAERLHDLDRHALVPIDGRRGTRTLLARHRVVRGNLEPVFLRIVAAAGLSPPETNVPFGRYEIDALWRAAGVAVEVDDWDTHRHRSRFEADRARDRALTIAGLRPIRVTHDDLTTNAARMVAELRALGVR